MNGRKQPCDLQPRSNFRAQEDDYSEYTSEPGTLRAIWEGNSLDCSLYAAAAADFTSSVTAMQAETGAWGLLEGGIATASELCRKAEGLPGW